MKTLLLVLILSLAGCATSPVPDVETRAVPPERVLDTTYLKPAPGTGQVSIKRDRGFLGSGCEVRVLLNTKPEADLKRAEKLVLFLPAGEYVIGAQPIGGVGICTAGSGTPEARATVRSGDSIAFRVGSPSGVWGIQPTAF